MTDLAKQQFIGAIEIIRTQMVKDKKCSEMIAEIFKGGCVGLYDNSNLIKVIISLLQVRFPRGEDGHCGIEFYCFELNFGKIGEQELITVEDLWDELTKND